MQSFRIIVSGESIIVGVSHTPCKSQENKNIWQIELENDGENALIDFIADSSSNNTSRLKSMLTNGNKLKFKGTIQNTRVVATELYLDINSVTEVVL